MAHRATLLLVVLALLAAGCGSGDGGSERAAGEAAWAIQGEEGRLVTQVMDEEGTARRSVAPTAGTDDQTNPDWSPDGERLTFALTGEDGKDDLWVVGVDGTGARLLYDCTGGCDYIDDPAWSPDAATIAVCEPRATGQTTHRGSLLGIDVQTGGAKVLFAPTAQRDFCAGPRWSPDGKRVVLELAHRDGLGLTSGVTGVTLAVVDLATDPPTVHDLTDPRLFAATADWSAAINTIVYSARVRPGVDRPDLYTIDPEGSAAHRLTTLAADNVAATEPGFARDGRSVVFVADATPVLRRVDLESGEVTTAFAPGTTGNHPRARP
jgi:Tol biopolymer transport system component